MPPVIRRPSPTHQAFKRFLPVDDFLECTTMYMGTNKHITPASGLFEKALMAMRSCAMKVNPMPETIKAIPIDGMVKFSLYLCEA
jgi:hypothetical protein